MSGQERALEEFRIEEERPEPAAVVLSLHGDADLRSAGELNDRLGEVVAAGPKAVIVDLADATLLDSSALAVLLGAMKRQHARGGRFRIVAPGTEIRRIFEVTLLDRVFELHRSRQEALGATDGRPRRIVVR